MKIPNTKIKEVVKDIKQFCSKNKIKLIFDHKNEYLDSVTEGEASAYFVWEPEPLIKISTVNRSPDEWLLNLIHETCHADQWMEDSIIWKNCFEDDIDVSILADLWINEKIELTDDQTESIFKSLVFVELDAEIRTINKIQEYGLHNTSWMDINQYYKQAWSYINTYAVAAIIRKWIPSNKPPYNISELVNRQPGVSSLMYTGNFDGIESSFLKYAIDQAKIYKKFYPELFPSTKEYIKNLSSAV